MNPPIPPYTIPPEDQDLLQCGLVITEDHLLNAALSYVVTMPTRKAFAADLYERHLRREEQRANQSFAGKVRMLDEKGLDSSYARDARLRWGEWLWRRVTTALEAKRKGSPTIIWWGLWKA